MSSIIRERLQQYASQTREEEQHALKEILQEVILYGLSESGFFKEALFQGGTSLRILYHLGRFSEDLDFILKNPNPNFKWQPFFHAIEETSSQYGIIPEVTDKSKMGNAVQKMTLKDNSIVKFLDLSFRTSPHQKLTIKLEIDTMPPMGSHSEIKFLDFPVAFSIETQDLASNFAGKSHALLCREYIKGRDWYDFLWYVSKKVSLNFIFLSNAINQKGPWAEQKIEVTPDWYLIELEKKIKSIDWRQAAREVLPFLNAQDRKTLELWGIPFFLDRVQKLKETLLS